MQEYLKRDQDLRVTQNVVCAEKQAVRTEDLTIEQVVHNSGIITVVREHVDVSRVSTN